MAEVTFVGMYIEFTPGVGVIIPDWAEIGKNGILSNEYCVTNTSVFSQYENASIFVITGAIGAVSGSNCGDNTETITVTGAIPIVEAIGTGIVGSTLIGGILGAGITGVTAVVLYMLFGRKK